MSGALPPEVPPPRKARTVPRQGRPSALRIPIQIDPSDLRPKLRSWWDRFRSELRSSLSGAAVSLGAHLALLFILALIVVRHAQLYEPPGLQGGWVTPTVAPTRNREVVPVRIESVKLDPANRPMTPKETKPVDAGNQPAETHAPVKAVGMDEIFAARSERVRSKALEQVGANNRIEAAISNGLSWLARQQLKAGNWKLHEGYPDAGMSSLRTDSGATALALLPFLGTGNTHMNGTHREAVRRGLEWLRGVQKPKWPPWRGASNSVVGE